jgi:hypothetical protein
MGEKSSLYVALMRKDQGNYFADLGIDGRIILKLVFKH